MEKLSNRERDLVGLGAALGSNCARSVETYLSEARNAGLTDQQLDEAMRLADGIGRAVAQSVVEAGLSFLSKPAEPETGAKPKGQPRATDQGREASAEGKSDRTDPESQSTRPDRKWCCC